MKKNSRIISALMAIVMLLGVTFAFVACDESTTNITTPEGQDNAPRFPVWEQDPNQPVGIDNFPGLIPFGLYHIRNVETGLYIALNSDGEVVLSETPIDATISFEMPCERRTYLIMLGDTRAQALASGFLTEGAPLLANQLPQRTDLNVEQSVRRFHWVLNTAAGADNNMVVTIAANNDRAMGILAYDGDLVIGAVSADTEAAHFELVEVYTETAAGEQIRRRPQVWWQTFSRCGSVLVRVPGATVRRQQGLTISYEMLQEWADETGQTFHHMKNLTGSAPFDFIIVKGYMHIPGVGGYAMQRYNTATITLGNMIGDLRDRVYRYNRFGTRDLGFTFLHEIGHMFHFARYTGQNTPWNFHGEVFASFLPSYVMYRTGTTGSPRGMFMGAFDYRQINHRHIQAFNTPSYGSPEGRAINLAQARLWFIADLPDVGWCAFKAAFRYYLEPGANFPRNASRLAVFDFFLDRIAYEAGVSGERVRSVFLEGEMDFLRQHLLTGNA